MKFRISAWSIQNPIPVVVLFIAILVAGLMAYRAMPIKLYPDVSFPIVQVAVALPSAAATEVETQVTRVVGRRRGQCGAGQACDLDGDPGHVPDLGGV